MGPGRGRGCGGVGGEAPAWARRRAGTALLRRREAVTRTGLGGLRRPRGHADCEGVQTLPGPPPSRGGDSAAARVIAVFVPSVALASQAAALRPARPRRPSPHSARAARMRLPGLDLGFEWEEEERRRLDGMRWGTAAGRNASDSSARKRGACSE